MCKATMDELKNRVQMLEVKFALYALEERLGALEEALLDFDPEELNDHKKHEGHSHNHDEDEDEDDYEDEEEESNQQSTCSGCHCSEE
jgi:hypothetical protein